MSKIENSMDFEFVNSWAGVIVPGNIIFVGRDKDNQPIWAEVLESETTGHGLCEEILTIRYRLLDTGVKGEEEFYAGDSVTVVCGRIIPL